MLSLIEEVERNVDKEKAPNWPAKVKSGKGFDLEDFREQLAQMRNMGGMMGMLDKLPGMSGLPDNIKDQMDDKLTVRMEAIISSMTPKERAHPDLIKGSRKRRIAAGSGMQVQDVNKLLKQFTEMQRMMKKMSGKGGMRKMMGQMKNMLPPDSVVAVAVRSDFPAGQAKRLTLVSLFMPILRKNSWLGCNYYESK